MRALDPAGELQHLRDGLVVAQIAIEEVVLPEHGHVIVDGLRLHYLDWGHPRRQPILFLHGGGLTARTWDLVCLSLRDGFRCLALDQRGHGDSEWSAELDYTFESHVRDVCGVAEALELSSIGLVGHSLGAFVAIEVARRRPELVRALVLVDAVPYVSAGATAKVSDFILGPSEFGSLDAVVERARSFNPRRDERLLRRSLQHNLRRLPSGAWTWKYDRRHLSLAWIDQLRRRFNELSDELGAISCPTLVVRGEESDAMSDADAQRAAEAIPRARWTRIAEAGHTVQGDNPGGLAIELGAFLREAFADHDQ